MFYSLGTFCLPMGDFSMLSDLPEMYRQCKATEDKDMTPIDFITDHLVNIDGLFDKHECGDEQKPHTPNTTQHQGQTQVSVITYYMFPIKPYHPVVEQPFIVSVNFLLSDYISKIFHPPVF